MITAHIDGSCSPANPGGKMGVGVLMDYGYVQKRHTAAYPRRKDNTNNLAEYLALKMALDLFRFEANLGNHLLIKTDSSLVANQMNELNHINKGSYMSVALECLEIIRELRKLNTIEVKWIPREENSIADELSKDF